jgi:pumilio family protein 6
MCTDKIPRDNKIRDMVIPEFYGHVRRLINHPEASWILDDIYRSVASKEQKAILLREFYGPEFALFKSAGETNLTGNLSEILEKNPEKRKPIMEYLHGLINQLIQKKLTGFTMLHDAMLQYFLNISVGSAEMGDYLKLIIGDNKEEEVDLLKNLAFTKPGSRVVCLTLAHGSAKDRKQILRAYDETVSMLAMDPNGHTVLMTAYDVVDDTRETTKRIFSELVSLTKDATPEGQQEKILPLAEDLIGRISLLYPFAGATKWLVHNSETQALIKEVEAIRATTSKKAPETRRAELVTALSPSLLTAVAQNATTLVQTPNGCQFINEVLLDGVGDKSAAVAAVAELAPGDPSEEGHVAQSPAAGRMLKTLIAGGHFDPKNKKVTVADASLGFHNQLYKQIKPFVVQWATGESSFVVVALLEAEGFSHKDELKKKLVKAKAELEAATAKKPEPEAVKEEKIIKKGKGAKTENGADPMDIDGEEKSKTTNGKKAKKNNRNRHTGGNAGAKLLLGML